MEVVRFSADAGVVRKQEFADVPRKKLVKDDSKEEDSQDLYSVKTDIRNFLSSSLTGKEKYKFDSSRLLRLGAVPLKPQKVPYKMALGIKRAKGKRERQADELARLSANSMHSLKSKRKKKVVEVKGRGRWKETNRPLDSGRGKPRGTAIVLSKSDIAKVQGRRKR